MPENEIDHPPKLQIDWLKTAAGSLAAVTTAVLLSTLGAAGTVIGAALGSVVVTVGSEVYAQGLARSRHTVRRAQGRKLSWGLPRKLPWRQIGLGAAATFVVVGVAITSFEALAGRSVSSYTGGSDARVGSTLGGVTGNSGDTPDRPQQSQEPSDFESPSQTPSESPTEPTEPATSPTEPPTPAATETPSPTETPTPPATAPTPTPSVSPTQAQ